MFGAIAGAIGGNLVSGLLDNVMGGGNGGGGPMGGLGDFAQKLLDPLGLFGGQGNQQTATGEPSGEMKELLESLQEMVQELMSMLKEQSADTPTTATASETFDTTGLPINISSGSGDDVVNFG
jgi:hypothetical protein